jgi:hypothetical protein
MQRNPELNPNSVALVKKISEVQTELDSEQNRLGYALKKLQIASDAYKHALGVSQPKLYDLRRSTTFTVPHLPHSNSSSTVETMNTLDEEEMNHQL